MSPAAYPEVVIECPEGSVRATPIKLWNRDEPLEHTPAETVRNVVIALFDANPGISRIAMVLTRGSIPLLICEVGHGWFHVGGNQNLKAIALKAFRQPALVSGGAS